MSQIISFGGGGGGGGIVSIVGTPNQITVTNGAGPVTTLSIPADFIAPGSITATTDFTVLGGFMSFRGDTVVGFTGSQWITTQSAVQTLDATPTLIAFLPFNEGDMALVKGYINGFRSTFADAVGIELFAVAYRPTGGDVTIVGFPTIGIDATNPATGATVTVDIPSQQLRINVVGAAGQTFNWVGVFSFMYLHNET